ncbi:hypothetical protein STRINF_01029 [Streptococcus infantarius subsp. infantarius ATCC BAA-102]|uniref:Uncharacterized protein n=1 Tax=Streptococcus infantarius subsp. infantarius ATCC BAA-102 TaxID=471872 RepID=A0ABM9XEE3_9STRE|nr:hypothetical protein STRINF_01029 [Streptococcus infantarius subsp. infantarius ATCC BAA-102]
MSTLTFTESVSIFSSYFLVSSWPVPSLMIKVLTSSNLYKT